MKPSDEAILKPCPFCGGEDVEIRRTITVAMVACNNCGGKSGLVYFGANEATNAYKTRELTDTWNTRALPPAMDGQPTADAATVAPRDDVAGIVAWLRAEAQLCDCHAHEQGECACGAWDTEPGERSYKRANIEDLADAIERGDFRQGEG